MSFLDIDTSDAKDPGVVEGGKEYKLRITSFLTNAEDEVIRTNKNGDDYFMPLYEIETDEYVSPVSQYMPVPDKNKQDAKKYAENLSSLNKWKLCFDAPEGGFELEDMVGHEGFCILGVKDDAEYGEQNVVKKMMTPAF